MLILGIETSCDETSCAVLEDGVTIRSNIISSSLFRHRPFGGVVPEIASRHALEQIDFVLERALKKARVRLTDLDLIAVTAGPGLMGALLVGVSFAKALSWRLGIPLVAVNHLEAHLSASFMSVESGGKRPRTFIGLLVSGGHTLITHHQGNKVCVMGETTDDAVGEAYDKVAKILGLGFPGGPILDKLAPQGNPTAVFFTKPKQKERFGRDANHCFDFSYSGIKTAVLYHAQKERARPGRTQAQEVQYARDIAASFQHHAIGWLVEKTMAAAAHLQVKTIAVGGGVSANSYLRKRMSEETLKAGLQLCLAPLSLTGDNAAMIARRGFEIRHRRASLKLTANPNLKLVSSAS